MEHQSNSTTTHSGGADIEAFVEQLAREYFMDFPDRRSERRYRMTVPVSVTPADDDANPKAEPLRAVTRDLSASGIGLVSQDPFNGKLIVRVVSPSGTELNAIAEVLRCEPNGYYFDVGCRFLCTL